MRAGQLRHRVALQTAVEAANGYGEVIKTWSTAATVWASVEFLAGREYFAARQAEAETTVRITIRQRSGIHERMRAVWDGRTFDIESVIADPTNARQLQLMCQEVT